MSARILPDLQSPRRLGAGAMTVAQRREVVRRFLMGESVATICFTVDFGVGALDVEQAIRSELARLKRKERKK